MNGMRRTAALIGCIGFVITFAPVASAQQLKSPDDVKTALKLLVQVSNDFKRQITNKNFTRIPHENMEFMEAAEALRTSIKNDPNDFKSKVEGKLKTAVADYQKVSDMSAKETDVNKLMAEHARAVTAMNAVFEMFPASLRPDPNLPPPGRGGNRGSN